MTRSENMSRIRSKNTKPEMTVRKLLWSLGYRYWLHCKNLPGKPDIVFPGRRKVIFINGCFWHGHDCKEGSRIPKSNLEYWMTKRERNKRKDEEVQTALESQHWNVMVIWECELKEIEFLQKRLQVYLG